MTAIRPHPDVRSLANELLEEVRTHGLPEVSMHSYQVVCNHVVKHARDVGARGWTDGLGASYLAGIDARLEAGEVCHGYRRFQGRVVRMLSSLARTGRVDFSSAPAPVRKYPVGEEASALVERILRERVGAERARGDMRAPVRHLLWYAAVRGVAPLQIDDALVMEFLLREAPATNAGSTGRTLRAVRIATGWLRDHGADRLLRDYSLLTLRNQKRRIIPAFSEAEIGAIAGAIDDGSPSGARDRAIVLLAYCTGLRACDIGRLRLSDIDWRGQSLTVAQAKTHEPITCELNGETMNALADYVLGHRPDCGVAEVFVTTTGPARAMSAAGIRSRFEALCASAGVEKLPGRSFHSLRRAFATTMVSKGVPIETASQMMGHKTIEEDKPYITHDRRTASVVAIGLADVPVRAGRYLAPAEGGGRP